MFRIIYREKFTVIRSANGVLTPLHGRLSDTNALYHNYHAIKAEVDQAAEGVFPPPRGLDLYQITFRRLATFTQIRVNHIPSVL